jgi:glucokinase
MPKATTPPKKQKSAAAKPGKKSAPRKIKFWIGFDLGGTKMLGTVLDENFNVLGTARKATNGSDGSLKGVKRIVSVIQEAMVKANVDPKGLQGIGMGCPGLVDSSKGVLLSAPNLGWRNVALRKRLKTIFSAPVVVLNDVDAGTFGEFKLGAGKGARSLLGVFPGTGVGAGFVYNGQLVHGRAVSAMELGQILLPGTHLGATEFGAVPLEDLTSRLALASQAGVACYRGQLPELDKKTKGALRDIRSKALASAFHNGEEAAMIMFRNSIRYLGMGVAIVVNLFAPDQITMGGGLVEEMPQLYVNALREEVNRYAMPGLAKGVKYTFAKLGGNAVAIGSVSYLREFGEV